MNSTTVPVNSTTVLRENAYDRPEAVITLVSPPFDGSNLSRPLRSHYFRNMKSMCAVIALAAIVVGQTSALAQSEQSTGARKVIRQVVPIYPYFARSMSLSGMVRLEALVTADGEAKTIQVKGGHPILAQAALNAVRAWKWQKSDHETTELLEFAFKP